tara:strand:- start:49 stop:255 length:207 start_codon:yes stop_codon:yes gene_type:complete
MLEAVALAELLMQELVVKVAAETELMVIQVHKQKARMAQQTLAAVAAAVLIMAVAEAFKLLAVQALLF